MRKYLAIIISGLVLSLVGCGAVEENEKQSQAVESVESQVEVTATDKEESEENVSVTSEEETTQTNELDEVGNDLAALGDIEVDAGLFTVEVTIPKDFVGDSTQEELDVKAEEAGYKSVTLNEDGSATYVMTKKQHEEMLEGISVSIYEGLDAMITSEDYSFTEIKANNNFTDFEVRMTNEELNFSESFSVLSFYMYGGMYGIFSGEEVDNIHVAFINDATGDIIDESNSADMGK